MEKLFEPKKVKKVNTTTFEVNDNNRSEAEYRDPGTYEPLFISFLESLGYVVEVKHPGHPSLGIVINECPLYIETKNASFAYRNAYTRDIKKRKPKNRYVALSLHSHSDTHIVKVYVNEEMDADKIRGKIDAAIAAYHNKNAEFEKKKQTDFDNTNKIGNHYLSFINKEHVDSIRIDQGFIVFHLTCKGHVSIHSDGSLYRANLDTVEDISTLEMLRKFVNTVNGRATRLIDTVERIVTGPKLSTELTEWVDNARHRYFKTDIMSAEK